MSFLVGNRWGGGGGRVRGGDTSILNFYDLQNAALMRKGFLAVLWVISYNSLSYIFFKYFLKPMNHLVYCTVHLSSISVIHILPVFCSAYVEKYIKRVFTAQISFGTKAINFLKVP
jgi:hypothetical protein